MGEDCGSEIEAEYDHLADALAVFAANMRCDSEACIERGNIDVSIAIWTVKSGRKSLKHKVYLLDEWLALNQISVRAPPSCSVVSR